MPNPIIGIAAKVVADAARTNTPRKAIRREEPKPYIPWYTRLAIWWRNL